MPKHTDGKIAVTTVNTVASGNMHSVTSNAVAEIANNIIKTATAVGTQAARTANAWFTESISVNVPENYIITNVTLYHVSASSDGSQLRLGGIRYAGGSGTQQIIVSAMSGVSQTVQLVYLLTMCMK